MRQGILQFGTNGLDVDVLTKQERGIVVVEDGRMLEVEFSGMWLVGFVHYVRNRDAIEAFHLLSLDRRSRISLVSGARVRLPED